MCRLAHGVRGTRRVSVTAGERIGTQTEFYSLDVPLLSVLTRGNWLATGSASVAVQGAIFGHVSYTQSIRVGVSACEVTDWQSDTSVVCRIGHGVSGTRRVTVTAGELVGTRTEFYSFDVPSLSVLTRGNWLATGSASVTVQGSSFGHLSYTQSIRVGVSACEVTDWQTDTSALCRIGQGVRGTRRVSVTAGERVGQRTEFFS